MPPRGVKKGTKRARQYEHIKDSLKEQGKSEDTRRRDRGPNRQQGACAERRGRDRVEALEDGHLVRSARWAPEQPQGPARSHP